MIYRYPSFPPGIAKQNRHISDQTTMASKMDEKVNEKTYTKESDGTPDINSLGNTPKSRWERSWPIIACGAGLFSDGYLNGVRFKY